jgi:CRISPR-associated protein Csx14
MTIRLAVDPTNPGQFFACCGLLELADRLWPGAEGWFSGREFRVTCDGSLRPLLDALVAHLPEAVTVLDNGLEVKPLIAPLRLTLDPDKGITFMLDAWTTIRLEKGEAGVFANPPWNFWAGQQTSHIIWRKLRDALAEQLTRFTPDQLKNLFTQRLFREGRYGFDPGPAWNALDVGFSPNDQGMKVASSPAVELLALVGLQRFRPVVTGRTTVTYATWGQPLPPAVAAACASGSILAAPFARYRCRVVDRGQGYAALGYSTPLRGAVDE